MDCLVARCRVSPINKGEFVAIVKDRIEPMLSREPGLRGVYHLINLDGEALILIIWELKEQGKAFPIKRCYESIREQLKSVAVGPVCYDNYEMLPPEAHSLMLKKGMEFGDAFNGYCRRFTGLSSGELFRTNKPLQGKQHR